MITTYVIIIAQGPGCLERPYPREEVFFHYGTMTERKNNVRREDKRRKYNVRNEENNISFAAHHSNGGHPVYGIRHLLQDDGELRCLFLLVAVLGRNGGGLPRRICDLLAADHKAFRFIDSVCEQSICNLLVDLMGHAPVRRKDYAGQYSGNRCNICRNNVGE